MNKQDKENIEYIVKTLRENASLMSDKLDKYDAAKPEFGVALEAKNSMMTAYMMLLSAMQFGDLDWQSHQDCIKLPQNAKFIKNGKLV